MEIGKCDFDPVAIVLTKIDSGPTMRFTGIDLESGTPISVEVTCAAHAGLPDPGPSFQADGLVLLLTIDTALLDS